MSVDPFAALAQPDGVRSALATVFGRARIGPIVALTGGATTASVYRIEVGERPYLLRIEGQPSPLRNPHQYASMRIAAEAGIAPKILYVDEAARIVVTDFIEQVALEAYPGGPPALARALGELLARGQATEVFPCFVEYPDIVARLFAHVRRTGLFAGGVLDQHVERLELLRGAYRASSSRSVSSHNDVVPNNILFDGRRLWLIDWESAYCNDPLVDVAIVLDGIARSPELEEVLLGAWLGRTPDESIRARLDVVRAIYPTLLRWRFSQRIRRGLMGQARDRSLGSFRGRFSTSHQRRSAEGRYSGSQTHPRQDVSRIISVRCGHAGI